MSKKIIMQLLSLFFFFQGSISILGYSELIKSPKLRRAFIFEEKIVLIVVYLLLCSTDLNSDVNSRDFVGWVIIIYIIVIVLFKLSFIVYDTI